MIEVYLFDWGDTLMVDTPGASGKMCDWETVEAVDGALEALEYLSRKADIFVATSASESTEAEIEKALAGVGLSQFVTGYFCKANLGMSKGSPGFLPAIVDLLGMPASSMAMVGDSLQNDIRPAAAAGMKPIWLSHAEAGDLPENTRVIKKLSELCE
jgi:putative hydrolase of the HAD superfamily